MCSIAGGELFERIMDDNFEYTEPTSVRYMKQILEGIQYVHQKNIVHLDLKPENIVCVNTTGTLIKIIDFGLASKLGKSDTSILKVVPLQVITRKVEFFLSFPNRFFNLEFFTTGFYLCEYHFGMREYTAAPRVVLLY